MKVLKRPMFKYGGDVKRQGIMHGMNGLRNGGIATTMADALGMANGGIMRQRYQDGLLVAPGINTSNVRSSPIENFYKNNTANVRGNYSDLNKPQKVLTRDERIEQQKKVFEPNYTFQDLYEKNMNVTDKQIPQQTRYGVIMVDNPNYGRVKRVDQVEPTGTMLMKQKEISEGIYPGGKKISEQEEFLKTEGGDKSNIKTPTLSKKDTDAERLERAYGILGVDDAKKDAVYNALIDLSQGQGIDTKDISGSINRAIGALSKRADKVTDLKDKAKAALASGTLQAELTKEINKEKGTPYDEKEKYFKGKLGDVKGERAAVGSPLSVFAALNKTKPGDSKSTRTEQAVTEYFDGIGGVPVYKGPLPGLELETINVGEETETEDGAYRIGTGYIVVEKGIITEKKNLFPKK